MNIEERLLKLMQIKGINKNQLSKYANIPYTTIDGMFKKGCDNMKLSNLIKLADYFDVSIDYLIGRGSEIEYNLSELKEIESFKDYLKYRRNYNGEN